MKGLVRAAVLVSAVMALGASTAQAASLRVSLGSLSQRAIVRTGQVPVRVNAPPGATVQVTLLVRAPVARAAVLRSVGVRLSPGQRRGIASCRGAQVTAIVRAAGRSGRVSEPVRVDRPACVRANSRGLVLDDPRLCDVLIPRQCLLPFPSDRFTVRDRRTATGRRVAIPRAAAPRNSSGVPIDTSDHNRADGFSPGALIVARTPGFDNVEALLRSRAVTIRDMAAYGDRRAPVMLIDLRTGRRHPIWVEVDANATSEDRAALLIHPTVNLRERGRYAVALRRLRTREGKLLAAPRTFRLFRDRLITNLAGIERRRPQMERLLGALGRMGIARDELYLAWDFTVASERSLTARALHIRDDAFALLGDRDLSDLRVEGRAPAFTLTSVQELTPEENPDVARRVRGTLTVPCYLNQPGCPPGSRFRLVRGLPRRTPGNTMQAPVTCTVPRSALVAPARPLLFGHGLLGDGGQVTSLDRAANEHNFVACATDWVGMSAGDLPNVFAILADISRFPTLADRVQQSFVNFMYLGRLMVHPEGLSALPAFHVPGGASAAASVIDTRRLFFNGNSQGGILGGALTALAPDWERAVLGVPGMNFSTLLTRSIHWARFSPTNYAAYPNELERPLGISLVQMLWDRAESNGYAHHIAADPLADTPRHTVLLLEAFGDHQVANVATETMARTLGARLHTPALDSGRSNLARPFYGLRPLASTPFAGSALEVFDIGPLRDGGTLGTPPPPEANIPPGEGRDPHGVLGAEEPVQRQVSDFLRVGGTFVDVCGPRPCYAAGWTGP